MRSLGFALVLASSCALPAPVAGHDWYKGLTAPNGIPCCSDRDCGPVAHRYDRKTSRLEIRVEKTWVPVDPAKVLPHPSPDGKAHACIDQIWSMPRSIPVVRCVILPGTA